MGIKRDFSQAAIENLRKIIKENVDDEKEWGFVDWVHDFFMDDLNVTDYLNDIDTYHSKMCDKHDISSAKFDEIIDKLHIVDTNYAKRLNSISEGLGSFYDKITNVAEMIDPSAVTLDEHSYDEILDGIEKQTTKSLDDVKADIDSNKQELKNAKEAYEEIPWYEAAGYKALDTLSTAADYADFLFHGLGKGLRNIGSGAMAAGGGIMIFGGEVEVATAGGGTIVVVPEEVIGGVTFVGGGICYVVGNILYCTTDGTISNSEGSYDRAKDAKDSAKDSAKEKASGDAGKLEEVNKPNSSSIPDKAKDIANQVKSGGGKAPNGYKGGRTYKNIPLEDGAQKLPEGVKYREYDVNPYVKGQNRGAERIVIGDDGSVWYTSDHYFTFKKIQ